MNHADRLDGGVASPKNLLESVQLAQAVSEAALQGVAVHGGASLQRSDLAGCLARLWREIEDGAAYFKLYRQFKMYNDPALNPWLQGKAYG